MESLFIEHFYLQQNPDVAAAVAQGGGTAWEHFLLYGQYENRVASPFFDPQAYLEQYPDVAQAVAQGLTTPYEHFLLHGQYEDRQPFKAFDADFYAAANPDLAQAIQAGLMTATQHFMQYGLNEFREFNPAHSFADFRIENNYTSDQSPYAALLEFFKVYYSDDFSYNWQSAHTTTPSTPTDTDGYIFDPNAEWPWLDDWLADVESSMGQYAESIDYTEIQDLILNSGLIEADGQVHDTDALVVLIYDYFYPGSGQDVLDLVGSFNTPAADFGG